VTPELSQAARAGKRLQPRLRDRVHGLQDRAGFPCGVKSQGCGLRGAGLSVRPRHGFDLGFVRGLLGQPRTCPMMGWLETNMPSKPKTWKQKMNAKPPHTVVLDKDFAGVPAGARLLISCPMEVENYLRTKVPPGETREIQQMRRELAAAYGADAACPVSTAIFLRTVAEAAWDEIEAGTPISEVAPFWRVVDPQSPLARKLRAGGAWIEQQRLAEREA